MSNLKLCTFILSICVKFKVRHGNECEVSIFSGRNSYNVDFTYKQWTGRSYWFTFWKLVNLSFNFSQQASKLFNNTRNNFQHKYSETLPKRVLSHYKSYWQHTNLDFSQLKPIALLVPLCPTVPFHKDWLWLFLRVVCRAILS